MSEWVSRRCRLVRGSVSILAIVLAGCGSSHHSGTTTPSNSPVISDLGVATSPQGCSVQGFAGHPRTVTFTFMDTDGNETGGHVDLVLSGGGPTQSLASPVPSGFVTISGTTSGTITVLLCIAVVGGSATLTVSLTDAAGNTSNTLSAAVAGLRAAANAAVGMGLSAL
jgi:hypothetical protein